jgi:hypothetical protein
MSFPSSGKVKRFCFRFALITLIIFICDQGIGHYLKHLYFRQRSGLLYRTTYAIDSTRAELLVFGSSRANHHYVSELFDDSLHLTTYNTGRDGNFTLFNFALFKAITTRYQPKMIIMDINPDELGYDANSYERLSSLLPYYHDHREIRPVVELKNPFEKLKLSSAIYPYNSLLLTIIMGNLDYNKNRNPDVKGYVPIFTKMKADKIGKAQLYEFSPDENKTRALTQIMTECRDKKINLLFVRSPVFQIDSGNRANSVLSELCAVNHVRYLDLSNKSLFISNPRYFADINHLNDDGARLFTNLLINLIRHPAEIN